MSQLHSLLNTCDEKERERLDRLTLRGKEKEVFDLVYDHIGKELPENDALLKRFDITETHLYKINSVLVRKCYEVLEPEGGFALLEFLRKKNLYVQLRHELGVQDKLVIASAGTEEKERFYLSCFRLLIDVPYRYYDKKLTDAFGKKYLGAKKNKTLSDELYLKFQGLFADMNRAAAQKDPQKASGITVDKLKKFEAELEGSKHFLAQYYLYRSFCSYYSYYEKNAAMVQEYLKKAISLKEKVQPFFPVDVAAFLQLLSADALFQDNQFKEAFDLYEKVFAGKVDEQMYGYHYHCEQHALLAIICGENDKAFSILKKVFDPCIEQKQDIYATRGAMTYAKLYTAMGDHKKALNYINIAREINEKTFYLPFDLQLRVLENLCFYFKGDDDFAHQLTVRNLKFLHSQKMDAVLKDYVTLFRIISAFIKCRQDRKPLPAKYQGDFDRISKQYMNLYCNLLCDLDKKQ